MSADDYVTVRQLDNGNWGLFHGFMSNLEDGLRATYLLSEHVLEIDALRAGTKEWTEYGLILEGDEDD